MSKFWQGRASWKETVSSTVTGLSDGAARLRQNLQVPADGRPGEAVGTSPESQAGKAQQYLRLPVESAKKLRWYDRPDLNHLVQQNLREKNDLLGVNAALRQVLLSKGISEDDLETELEEKLLDVDRTRAFDEGVNSVLVASAADEIASLRSRIDQQANEIGHLKDRLKLAENAGGSAESTNQDDHQPKATSHQPQQQAFGTPPRYPSPTPVSIASPAHPSTAAPQACFASQGQAQQPLHIPASVQASSEGTLPQNEADNLSESASLARPTLNSVQLVLKVFESSSSVQATLLPVAEDVRLTKQQSSEGVGEVSQQSVGGAAATGPLGDVSAGPSHHQVIEDQSTESGSVASTGGQAPLGSEEGMPSLEEVQRLLTDEKRKTAALLGKLQRLEQERQAYVSQLEAQGASLQEMDRQARQLETQAKHALQNLQEVSDASERQIAHLRAQAATSSGQHLEALRKAQEICTQTEARADAADRRAQKAEGDLRRVTADQRVLEHERNAAESRAAAAQAEHEKGSGSVAALAAAKRAADDREAELRRSLKDAESGHKQQLANLDATARGLQRALATSQQEVSSLEQRLTKAEQSEGEALRELREAELAVGDQERLLARAAALEDKLKEYRAEQGQLENYKQLTKELEAAKARVEDEVIATVHIATQLEGRLRQAKQDADLAQQQAQQAQQRANQAEQSVEAETDRRLASIGSDRTRWPAPAREEVLRLEKKQQALSSMLEALQHSLSEESEGRQAEALARADAQERCSAADEHLSKLEWESNQANASLQRKVTLLQQQLDDMRQAAAEAEQERDRLAFTRRRLPSRSSFGSLGPNTPKRGGGSLRGAGAFDDDSGTPTANGSHREHMDGVDIVYLKNVLLKFVDAHAHGRTQECSTLLPAIAALLRATPLEYRILKDTLQRSEKTGNWWARAVS